MYLPSFSFALVCAIISKKFRSSNANHLICSCPICTCTCNASFRRDQLQSIHTAKRFEDFQKSKQKKISGDSAFQHTVIHEITSAITAHAKDAIVEVLQQGSPIKAKSVHGLHGKVPNGTKCSSRLYSEGYDPRELQVAIERSLGMTVLNMAKDPQVSGSIALKNALREEMGGMPTTHLLATQESVGQHRQRMGMNLSRAKCSRESRNGLVDLYSSDEGERVETASKKQCSKMKKAILLSLLTLYKNENDKSKRNKIKYAMKALDEKNDSVTNEMIDFTFNAFATEIESFDSMDAALNILDFAEDENEEQNE